MANAYAKTRINVTNLEPGENGKYVGDAFVINEININEASTTESGLMSSEDKVALDTLVLSPLLKIYKENITVDAYDEDSNLNWEITEDIDGYQYKTTVQINLPYNVSNNIHYARIECGINSLYTAKMIELAPTGTIEYDDIAECYLLTLYAVDQTVTDINLDLIVLYSS